MIRNVVIMAGGEGRRLRPLTDVRPKPLMPMLDDCVIGMTLRLLKRHSVKEATITLHYRAEDIRRALGDGSAYGVHLHYAEESIPRGTAGSVRDAAQDMQGTVLVLSGDGLTDADLTALYNQHRESGAPFSMVVKRVQDASLYGVCAVDAEGRIVCFREKPQSAPAGSLVNTGIYLIEREVLDRVPPKGSCDFGRDLIPALLAAGVEMHALETDAYWCDIGSHASYQKAQMDLLAGRVGLQVHGQRRGSAIIGRGCHLSPDVRIAGRCYIGDGAYIGRGTVLGPGTVICPGALVGSSVYLENACLWENARIDNGSIIKRVVVTPGTGGETMQRMVPFNQL